MKEGTATPLWTTVEAAVAKLLSGNVRGSEYCCSRGVSGERKC
jgi:hypothetical protein